MREDIGERGNATASSPPPSPFPIGEEGTPGVMGGRDPGASGPPAVV
jgi:hypothetical protein